MEHELARELANCASDFTYKHELFASMITGLHRTEQQNVMKLFIKCMEQWAKDADNGYFDLRNEATVKASKKFVELISTDNIHFPYI